MTERRIAEINEQGCFSARARTLLTSNRVKGFYCRYSLYPILPRTPPIKVTDSLAKSPLVVRSVLGRHSHSTPCTGDRAFGG